MFMGVLLAHTKPRPFFRSSPGGLGTALSSQLPTGTAQADGVDGNGGHDTSAKTCHRRFLQTVWLRCK